MQSIGQGTKRIGTNCSFHKSWNMSFSNMSKMLCVYVVWVSQIRTYRCLGCGVLHQTIWCNGRRSCKWAYQESCWRMEGRQRRMPETDYPKAAHNASSQSCAHQRWDVQRWRWFYSRCTHQRYDRLSHHQSSAGLNYYHAWTENIWTWLLIKISMFIVFVFPLISAMWYLNKRSPS